MSNPQTELRKQLGKRELREAIEDAWYNAPTANAGFGRIQVIVEQQIHSCVTQARIEALQGALADWHNKQVEAMTKRLNDLWTTIMIDEVGPEKAFAYRDAIQAERAELMEAA